MAIKSVNPPCIICFRDIKQIRKMILSGNALVDLHDGESCLTGRPYEEAEKAMEEWLSGKSCDCPECTAELDKDLAARATESDAALQADPVVVHPAYEPGPDEPKYSERDMVKACIFAAAGGGVLGLAAFFIGSYFGGA